MRRPTRTCPLPGSATPSSAGQAASVKCRSPFAARETGSRKPLDHGKLSPIGPDLRAHAAQGCADHVQLGDVSERPEQDLQCARADVGVESWLK